MATPKATATRKSKFTPTTPRIRAALDAARIILDAGHSRALGLTGADVQYQHKRLEISGTIFVHTYDQVRASLANADTDSPLVIAINSGGGDAITGVGIYGLLREWRADNEQPIQARVFGSADSAASVIMAAADERLFSVGSSTLIHDAWTFALGNARELRELAEHLDVISQGIADIYTEAFGGTADGWRSWMTQDRVMGVSEAIDRGVATGRLDSGQELPDSDSDTEPTNAQLTEIENEVEQPLRLDTDF